jgi:hypothetical protein
MSPELVFGGFFALTLALLLGAVAAGKRHRRRLHLTIVAGAVAALVATIAAAIELGRHYDLESAGVITPIHHIFARAATASFLLPMVSGVLLWRRPQARGWHRICAAIAFALTLLASITGIWMLVLARPL